MGIIIFLRTLMLGPLFSAVILSFSGFLASYFSGTHTQIDIFTMVGVTSLFIMAAYAMVFTPVFGLLPGIIPLLAYSILLSMSAGSCFYRMSKYGFKNRTKVLAITLLSIIIGVVIYGGFYQLTSLNSKVSHMDFLWFMVFPTSVIFGVWSGSSYVRERS